MPLLPNPWLDNPLPESKEQPDMKVFLRHFRNTLRKCYFGDYPYKLSTDKPDRIPFYELLGHGPPPKDIRGYPGDIYVDLNPPRSIYVKGSKPGWKLWNCGNLVELMPHPILQDRYMWKTVPRHSSSITLSWFAGSTIRDRWALSVKELVDPVAMIAELYHISTGMEYMGSDSASMSDFKGSRAQSREDGGHKVTSKSNSINMWITEVEGIESRICKLQEEVSGEHGVLLDALELIDEYRIQLQKERDERSKAEKQLTKKLKRQKLISQAAEGFLQRAISEKEKMEKMLIEANAQSARSEKALKTMKERIQAIVS